MAKQSDRKAQLPAALIRQLGRKADSTLAAEFSLPASKVRTERLQRGIGAFHAVEWNATQIALLGKMADNDVAQKIGVSNSAVFVKRTSLGIPPFGQLRNATKFQWKAAQLKKLGTMSDAALAAQLGVPESAVTARRHSMGVTASQPPMVPRKPWTKQELALLGKKPDTYVANATGRGRRHVRAKRESLGIPPFQVQRSIEWTAARKKQLGVLSDAELANQLGVSVGTVALYRRQQSNAASRKTKKSK